MAILFVILFGVCKIQNVGEVSNIKNSSIEKVSPTPDTSNNYDNGVSVPIPYIDYIKEIERMMERDDSIETHK